MQAGGEESWPVPAMLGKEAAFMELYSSGQHYQLPAYACLHLSRACTHLCTKQALAHAGDQLRA